MTTHERILELRTEADNAIRNSDLERVEAAAAALSEIDTPQAQHYARQVNGVASAMTGDFQTALRLYSEVLQYEIDHENEDGIIRAKGNLAVMYHSLGEYPKAVEYSLDVLEFFGRSQDAYSRALAHRNLGSLYHDLEEYSKAIEQFTQAFDLYGEANDPVGRSATAGNMGVALGDAGEPDESISWFKRAISIESDFDNPLHAAATRNNLVATLLHYEKWDEAHEELARIDATLLRDPTQRARYQQNTGFLALHQGDIQRASDAFSTGLSIAEEHQINAKISEMHLHLRDVAEQQQDFEGYVRHNSAYMRYSEEVRGSKIVRNLVAQERTREIEKLEHARERERAILYSTLPKSIAQRVLRGEDVSGDHHESVSVLFLDVVTFTSHTNHLSPNTVIDLLATLFGQFDQIAHDTSIMKVKTIGDAYMAVAFDDHDQHHAARALRAAHAMHQLNITWPGSTEPLKFRIGLHVGPVVAGVIGTERLQYDVWGHTVNLASRMESTGLPGQIHVSSDFNDAFNSALEQHPELVGLHSLTERGDVDVPGIGPMRTYWAK